MHALTNPCLNPIEWTLVDEALYIYLNQDIRFISVGCIVCPVYRMSSKLVITVLAKLRHDFLGYEWFRMLCCYSSIVVQNDLGARKKLLSLHGQYCLGVGLCSMNHIDLLCGHVSNERMCATEKSRCCYHRNEWFIGCSMFYVQCTSGSSPKLDLKANHRSV